MTSCCPTKSHRFGEPCQLPRSRSTPPGTVFLRSGSVGALCGIPRGSPAGRWGWTMATSSFCSQGPLLIGNKPQTSVCPLVLQLPRQVVTEFSFSSRLYSLRLYVEATDSGVVRGRQLQLLGEPSPATSGGRLSTYTSDRGASREACTFCGGSGPFSID